MGCLSQGTHFDRLWLKYPIEGVLPRLIAGDVEGKLEMMRRISDVDAAIPPQLTAVKFYLRDVI